ncbi:hypothetical protein [Terrisporobacter hibernicus]|uniref:Uncharacterized protein n=1 Tax=Terrisporobacter hibernicus TaxID=2813371 RepID=A0AAX2ZGZ4_9FIRM|nr:hypothetical protein [Terrisporobacter hibernicus]UEL47344.1 hypothetical protein JW646_17190 [Terrisporobacter hibernicus]
MKKWIDANLIAEQEAEVQKDKWEFERLMKEKPNFDKTKDRVKKRKNLKKLNNKLR